MGVVNDIAVMVLRFVTFQVSWVAQGWGAVAEKCNNHNIPASRYVIIINSLGTIHIIKTLGK